MWKATIKGILARKLRLALTTLAVLLGVAFVSGTYVLTDTMERSFDVIFRRTVTDVDLVVRARDPYTGGGSQRTRIPDATLARVRGGIYLRRDAGSAPGAVSRNVAAALGPSYEVVPASKWAEERAEPVRQGVGNLRMALVGFAAIGLVVGSFIIFNTFAILIAQRTRELGLLRALGANRAQVLWSVVLEAAIVGVVAAALGLAAGVGLAGVLLRAVGFARIGLGAPEASPVLLTRTIIAAMIVG